MKKGTLLEVFSNLFLVVGILFVLRISWVMRSPEGTHSTHILLRGGISLVGPALNQAQQGLGEAVREQVQTIYYRLSERIWVSENRQHDQIWMGRLKANYFGYRGICGDYLPDGGMSAPQYQKPYYYSYGVDREGPFRIYDERSDQIEFNLSREEFARYGLPDAQSNRVNIAQIRSTYPQIRMAPEECLIQLSAAYILIIAGIFGTTLTGIVRWLLTRRQSHDVG